MQIDTTNILFICGGAFGGLESVIENRIGKKTMGFGAEVQSKKERDLGELFEQMLPEDLLKYGLIPEFVGRMPIVVSLKQLDEAALVEILTKPKNALVKQFKYLLELDGVELTFEKDAVEEIAKLALERNTGARGLRSIIESIMMDVMYELPSRIDVDKCVVTKEAVRSKMQPTLVVGKRRSEALPEAK